jgi:hypothetical protein
MKARARRAGFVDELDASRCRGASTRRGHGVILAALAAAINAKPALAALGTTASVESPRLVTTGRIEEYVVSDNGLIGVRLVPALSPALQGLAWGLVCAIGLAASRRRRPRSRG